MPDVHIWVRKEDWGKWYAIENKPEWLHEHLALTAPVTTYSSGTLSEKDLDRIAKTMGDELPETILVAKDIVEHDRFKEEFPGHRIVMQNEMSDPTYTEPEGVA
jgi:hypothetical protein